MAHRSLQESVLIIVNTRASLSVVIGDDKNSDIQINEVILVLQQENM